MICTVFDFWHRRYTRMTRWLELTSKYLVEIVITEVNIEFCTDVDIVLHWMLTGFEPILQIGQRDFSRIFRITSRLVTVTRCSKVRHFFIGCIFYRQKVEKWPQFFFSKFNWLEPGNEIKQKCLLTNSINR